MRARRTPGNDFFPDAWNKARAAAVCTLQRTQFADIMNPPSPLPLSEADMQAFADGLLAPERAARVRAYLARRPDEARRVAFYARLNAQMQSIFRDVDGSAPPLRATRRQLMRLAAAVLACVALIAAAVFVTVRVPDEALERAALVALAPAPMHAAANAPDLSPAGFRAVGVRAVIVGAFATADAYVYRNAQQEPLVVLSVRGAPVASALPWRARRIGSARLFEWTSAEGVRMIVGGHAGTRGLMRAADLLTNHQTREP
jgi:anti-sigma factor RsiW